KEYQSRRSESSIQRETGTVKTDCPFGLVANYYKTYDIWRLRVHRDEHNHPLASTLEGHPYAMRLEDDEFHLVEELSKYNVQPRYILSTIKERNPDNVSSVRNVYNAQTKIRAVIKGDRTQIQLLLSHLTRKGYAYYERTNDLTNELEELFFVHPTSYAIWCTFPQIMIMDSTYNTTMFKLPFFEIKVIDEVHYPRVIVTDRDLALMGTCDVEFPNAKKLLCRWHISNNMLKHCRQRFKTVKEWDSVKYTWEHMIKAPTKAGFVHYYERLKELLVGHRFAVGIDLRENMWPAIRQNLLQALDNYEMLFTEMWLSDGFQRIRHTVDHFGLGIAPRDKWMCMPDTGLVIASLYNQPVIFISPEQSNTCFPLWHGPDRPQPKRPIVIALVGGIHYINLTLYENSPIPPNHPQWRWYASGNAPEWEDIYSNRHRVC
ncbi:PKS-NRPS hybrid synthetase, partial [Tanacetum coccineum]